MFYQLGNTIKGLEQPPGIGQKHWIAGSSQPGDPAQERALGRQRGTAVLCFWNGSQQHLPGQTENWKLSFLAMSLLPSLPADSLSVPWVLQHLEASCAEQGYASLGPGSQDRAWKRVQGSRCRGRDLSLLCFPSVSLYMNLPCSPTAPKVIPLPRALTQAQLKCTVGASSISTATNLPCSPEMCPLLAREGGHLWPLHHPRAGGQRVCGVHGPGSLHPGGSEPLPGVREEHVEAQQCP